MQNQKRFFQMRLSTMLLLVCLLGAVVAPLANKFVNHQRALSWVKANDIHVTEWHEGWLYNSPKKISIYGTVDTLEPLREFSELTSLAVVPITQPPVARKSITGQPAPAGRATSVLLIPQARISDLSPIENLTKLKTLNIMTTERVALPAGGKLSALRTIKITSPHILDPSPLKTFKELDTIHLNLLVEVYFGQLDSHDIAGKKSELVNSVKEEMYALKRLFPNAAIQYRTQFRVH